MGKVKNTNQKIVINFEEGLQHPDNSKSIPHHFKIEDKFVKLNPMEINYDDLNLNNGGILKTHTSHNDQKENQAYLIITTYDSYHIDHNWYVLQKHLYRGLVKVEGWVTDGNG